MSPVERTGGARAHDLAVGDGKARPPLQRAPGDAGDMPDVAHAVEDVGIIEPHLHRSKARGFGVVLRRFHQRPEPARLRDRVGVQQGDQLRLRVARHTIVRRGEPQILAHHANAESVVRKVQANRGAIRRGVIGDHRLKRSKRLGGEGVDAGLEEVAGVVGDDDDRHRRRVHSSPCNTANKYDRHIARRRRRGKIALDVRR